MNITIKGDNRDQILAELKDNIPIVLESIGQTAEGYAKDNCPVDTGRLRNSITYGVDENTVYIGTNVEYAPQQEYTDMPHKVGQAHFLRDSLDRHKSEYKAILEAALK